jgi:hypothetical protein
MDRPTGTFVLRMRQNREGMQFQFFSPGRVKPANWRMEGGTGLKYVKARLEESFPERWAFSQRATDGGWETRIQIKGAVASQVPVSV